MKWSYKRQCIIIISLTTILLIFAASLYLGGSIAYYKDRYAKNTHEQNICEVISSTYHIAACRRGGRYGGTSLCFVPYWIVNYNINETVPMEATIQQGAYRNSEGAQNRLDERQVSANNK